MILFGLKMCMGERNFFKIVIVSLFFIGSVRIVFAHDEFINVIAQSKPAVVSVEVSRTKKSVKSQAALDALGDNADFFFDDLKEQPLKGRGSGFIVNYDLAEPSNIFILTAAHVVRGASKVNVVFFDSKRSRAEIVWLSRKGDIALLKVKRKKSFDVALEFEDSAVLEGQSVLAIAGSFDLSISSSLGIISAVDVTLASKKKIKLIQTDAAINPGSSGGPLLNSDGKVVGLISNIYTKTGSFSGAAFAIPSPLLKKIIDVKK